jgi:hypothetical protein
VKVAPSSVERPTVKPADSSSAQAYTPGVPQARQYGPSDETFAKVRSAVEARHTPSFAPPTRTVAPSGESAKPKSPPVPWNAVVHVAPPSCVTRSASAVSPGTRT